MKNLIFSVFLLASCAATQGTETAPVAPTHYRTLNLLMGKRTLDNDWEPLQKQDVLGFEFSSQKIGAETGFEFGFQRSSDDDDFLFTDGQHLFLANVEATQTELYGGVRKTWNIEDPEEKVHPYIGGGLTLLDGTVEAFGQSLSDSTVTFYVHFGATFQVSESLSVGFDYRLLPSADLDIEGFDFDSSYSQVALVVAFHF